VVLAIFVEAAIAGINEDPMEKFKCMCNCDDMGKCDCNCQDPKTDCAPGYMKICPEVKGKCSGDTKAPLCPKDIMSLVQPSARSLENWITVRSLSKEKESKVGTPVLSDNQR